MTAAQRNLLLGPTIEEKINKVAPRKSLAELQAMSEAGAAQREAQRATQAALHDGDAVHPAMTSEG